MEKNTCYVRVKVRSNRNSFVRTKWSLRGMTRPLSIIAYVCTCVTVSVYG